VWCSGFDGSRWYITRVSLMGLACWTPTGERSWAHEVGAVGVVLVKGDTSSHVLICPRGEKASMETSICTVGIASIYVFTINTLGLAIWHPSMRIARSSWKRHQSMVTTLVRQILPWWMENITPTNLTGWTHPFAMTVLSTHKSIVQCSFLATNGWLWGNWRGQANSNG